MILNFSRMSKSMRTQSSTDEFCACILIYFKFSIIGIFFYTYSGTQIALIFLKKSWKIGREWAFWVLILSSRRLRAFSRVRIPVWLYHFSGITREFPEIVHHFLTG